MKSQKIHFIFITILSLNYIIPLIIFGDITLFYHDTLDSEIVFNKIIANSYKDNFESLKLLLNEEIRIEYLRRALQPFIFFYYFFSAELAYFTIDIFVKLTAYFSFFILAKKINSNILICAISAALFASINERTVEGFGFAIMPYIIYLISFKKNIKFKNFFLIALFGLNTDLVTCLTSIPALVVITYFLKIKKKELFLKDLIKVMAIFITTIIISNINLIYGQIKFGEIQRLDFFYEYTPLLNNIVQYFLELFKVPTLLNWTLLENFPQFILILIILYLVCVNNEKKSLQLGLLVIIINLVPFIFRTELLSVFRNSNTGILKTFHFEYIVSIIPLIFSILLVNVLKKIKIKYCLNFLFFILIFFQINSSIVPIYKKFINTKVDYRNVYTFKGYYMFDDYKKIKSIVKNQKTLSIGYDPMVAVMNNIYAIDGYHNIYPLQYKFKFRKIIEKELEKTPNLKSYYDNWGNRLYAYVTNANDISLNFDEAKLLGADYVISKYEISNEKLNLYSSDFDNLIYLYKLN